MNKQEEAKAGQPGQQLPTLQQAQKKSSLKSLKDIQERRSVNSARSRQNLIEAVSQRGLDMSGLEDMSARHPSLMNVTQDLIDLKNMGIRHKGKSLLEGNIGMYHTKAPGDSQKDKKSQQEEEKSTFILSGSMRKRSPSDFLRRKYQPVTPNKLKAMAKHAGLQKDVLNTNGDNHNLPGTTLPNMMSQTARVHPTQVTSNRQIGNFFQNQNSGLNLDPTPGSKMGSGNVTSRHNLRGQSKRLSPAVRPQTYDKARITNFSFSNAQPKEVSDFLQTVIQQDLKLDGVIPTDLDSTEPLDSFLDTLYLMIDEKVSDFSPAFQQRLHLAAGMRTEVCLDFLDYFAQLQTRNKHLINAVQFFNEYLTKISQLEGDKEDREKQVNSLIQEKEQLFLTRFDLEKKLETISTALEKAETNEREAAAKMKSLQKKFDAKVAECESLMFRIKHMEELNTMLEPPLMNFVESTPALKQQTPRQQNYQASEGGFDQRITSQVHQSPISPMRVSQSPQVDIERLRALEAANASLQTELEKVREDLKRHQELHFQDNSEHFLRVQEQCNKVQIENKQLRIKNRKLEHELEVKDRHIQHLEGKVTTVMNEKEDRIVNLKAEIVKFKAKIEEHERNFEARVAENKAKFHKEFQQNFSSQEKRLRDERDQLIREKADMEQKLNQRQSEVEQIATDFSKYRADITKKDLEKEQSINELQLKLKQSGQLNETQTKQLQERIETFNNQNQVLSKQNAILELKLRLIRDSVETLYRQKMFIVENIEKSSRDLARESQLVEDNMMNENGNKEYLISVSKAVKLSQTMVDMGLQAIAQVSQIVAFLKIDEVRNMIIAQDNEAVSKAHQKIMAAEAGDLNKGQEPQVQQLDLEKLNQMFQQEDIQDDSRKRTQPLEIKVQPEPAQGLRIHKFLTQPTTNQDALSVAKQEEHYYNDCPVELASILSKVLSEVYLLISSEQQAPLELLRLVNSGTRKADPAIEQEIYGHYLAKAKKTLEERINQLLEDNKLLKSQVERLQSTGVAGGNSREKLTISRSHDENAAGPKKVRNVSKLSAFENNQLQDVVNQPGKRESSVLGIAAEDSQSKRRISSIDSRLTSAKRRSPVRIRNDSQVLEQQIETLKLTLQEQKIKHKDLSMQLAQKIVLLEEQIEQQKLNQEAQLAELEQLHAEEVARTKLGVQQREAELMQRQNQYRERAEQAEEQLRNIQEQVAFLNSEIERITFYQREFDQVLARKDVEMASYKENLQNYMNLRVSKRSMFSLTLEITKDNESLVNEAMLRFYLNKCLKIDKEKFRFVANQEVLYSLHTRPEHIPFRKESSTDVETPDEEVTVVKVLIEIIDDQDNIDRYFKMMKSQIREGTSILYDLQPLYLSLCLGQCGLHQQDHKFFRDFHLIAKKGAVINQDEYIVSVLRHKQDPLSFKIITTAAGAGPNMGEEYVLDMQSRDLFELTEGFHSILESSEPKELINKIIDNLAISVDQHTGMKVLSCEYKVFFNPLFISRHVLSSERNATYFARNLFQEEKSTDTATSNSIGKSQPSQDSLAFRNTTFRNNQVLVQVASTLEQPKQDFQERIRINVECQTDQESSSVPNLLNMAVLQPARSGTQLSQTNSQNGSNKGTAAAQPSNSNLMDEVYVTTYQGYQRVGKSLELRVKIDEGQRTGTTVVTFEEIRSKDRFQVCLLNQRVRDRYVVHSECVKVQMSEEESHLLLLTFEKFQEDAFLIKMHDLKFAASEEYFILKKSNGQYARLTRPAGLEVLLANGKEHEELRNLIFDLTFSVSVPSQQILYANLAAVEQQMLDQQIDQVEEPFQLPVIKGAVLAQEANKPAEIEALLKSELRMPAVARLQQDPYQLPSGVLLQKHERGELLYRNIYTVRCVFEGREEKEHQSLISFYAKKDGQISVEVFLFKETQKMSIASQVSSAELFGVDHQGLSFSQKTEMLDQMMEKLYVLSEHGQYHLKVENDAIPMSQLQEHRKANQSVTKAQVQSAAQPLDRRGSSESSALAGQHELRLKDVDSNRKVYLAPEKCRVVKSYAQINERIYEYKVWFLLKPEKDPHPVIISPQKKKQQSKKPQQERQPSMANNVEDLVDFEYILVDVTDKQERKYSTLLSTKHLSNILMANPYEVQANWTMVQSRDKERLVEFLKHHTALDELAREIRIEVFQPAQELAVQLYAHEVGGVVLRREEQSLVDKRLLMNQEVDMSEFSYDVKLFQVFSKQGGPRKALSYSLELFQLNEPDLIYRYNYALHEQSSFVHSPVHASVDIINLVEHPLSRMRQNEEQKRRLEFQNVFQKYVDNRLLLAVHEQIFPHQISFCLYEASSRLHWSYTFDPLQADQEVQESLARTSLGGGRWNIEIGQLGILDQGTAERFLAMMMADLLDNSENAEVLQQDTREDNWADLGDTEALRYDLLKNRAIGEDLSISFSKLGVDSLKIEIRNNHELQAKESATPAGLITLMKQASMKSSSAINTSEEKDNNIVKFSVNATHRNKYVCKLLRLKDQQLNRLLAVICRFTDYGDILVKILELTTSTVNSADDVFKPRVLYQYTFKEKKRQEPDSNSLQNPAIERKHLEEALQEVCSCSQTGNLSAQVVERAGRIYEIITGKEKPVEELNILQNNISVTQRRLIAASSVQCGETGDKQQLILYRKTFFDESHEKLIIVSVSIRCVLSRKKGHGTAQLCMQEVEGFKLLIEEPETQRKMEFDLAVGQCFLEEELQGGIDLRNVAHLKKMARVLVEERAIIKRVHKDAVAASVDESESIGKESSKDSQVAALYTVEINLAQVNPLTLPGQTPPPRVETPQAQEEQQNAANQTRGAALNNSRSKQQLNGSIDNPTDSKNVGNIPEDEGCDEFEAMESALASSHNAGGSKPAFSKGGSVTSTPQLSNSGTSPMQQHQPHQPVATVGKSQSFRVGGPHQSIIEEEGSQEEYEDSPDVRRRATAPNVAGLVQRSGTHPHANRQRKGMHEEEGGFSTNIEEEEKQPLSQAALKHVSQSTVSREGEEATANNADMGYQEEMGEDMDEERQSQQQREDPAPEDDDNIPEEEECVLLYEQQVSEDHVMQVLRAPSSQNNNTNDAVFQVRQVRISDGAIQLHYWLEPEIVDEIVRGARLDEVALEQQVPELFETIVDYVVQKVIRHR